MTITTPIHIATLLKLIARNYFYGQLHDTSR